MEPKSSSQMRYFWLFYPMFANCVHAKRQHRRFCSHLHVNLFFQTNCSKFAVECDWNSKNSQNVQNLGFFWKIICVFWKKLEFSSKIDEGGNFAVEFVSNGNILVKYLFRLTDDVLSAKDQKIGKVREYDVESVFSRKKRFHLLKSLL